MKEDKTTRIWNPTEDQLWESYKNLKSYQKLEIWYGVEDKNNEIKRMKIVIPSGLEYIRDFGFAKDMPHKPFEVISDVTVFFKDYWNVERVILYVSQILCIRVLDEE
ncbi:hypothetical protein [Methanobrevibacter sp.]|uniref:hypothetical protein n=1 Tax=Methanobrevibacter sp. TaxID=66852 RepID=UPI00386B71A2